MTFTLPASGPTFRPARASSGRLPAPARPWTAWACRLTLRGLSWLPLGALHRIGGLAGAIAAMLPARPRRTTRTNLLLAYRHLADRDRQRLARRSLVESGRAACELAAAWLWPADRTLGLIREVVGESVVTDARAAGQGVILTGVHLGPWEVAGLYAMRQYGGLVFFQEPRIRELGPMITAARKRAGGTVVAIGAGGARQAMRTLQRGGVVIFVGDQDPGVGAGVFVPFFGVSTNTSLFVPRLAHRTGARVVILSAQRLPKNAGFRLRFEQASAAVCDADPARGAAALNADFEAVVRACPEQYLWSYKRFRIRPPGDADPYRTTKGLQQALSGPATGHASKSNAPDGP